MGNSLKRWIGKQNVLYTKEGGGQGFAKCLLQQSGRGRGSVCAGRQEASYNDQSVVPNRNCR